MNLLEMKNNINNNSGNNEEKIRTALNLLWEVEVDLGSQKWETLFEIKRELTKILMES